MRPLFLLLAMVMAGGAEENGAQRLENAQKGMAEGSWPRKPENRLSPLSGKMKDKTEISPKFYGQEREFRARSWGSAEKESGQTSLDWQAPCGPRWEEARWNQAGEWAERERRNKELQPPGEAGAARVLSYRELSRDSAPDWSSRGSSLAGRTDGSLRMYTGRLTRVREQVTQDGNNTRNLGLGRREQFSPEEVEKMLSGSVGDLREGTTGQSAGVFPPSTAGN